MTSVSTSSGNRLSVAVSAFLAVGVRSGGGTERHRRSQAFNINWSVDKGPENSPGQVGANPARSFGQ